MPRVVALFTILAAAVGTLAYTADARAVIPNNQGCLGEDFSQYAISGGSDFGQFNAGLAQWVPGLGLPIQFHLSGSIPDSYIPNSCND